MHLMVGLGLQGREGTRLTQVASLLLAASLGLSGCNPAPRLTEQQVAGKHLYNSRCSHCHDENDLALKPAPPNLHLIGDKGLLPSGGTATDTAIKHIVIAGKGKMPGFTGRFNDEQMAALIAYLRMGLR